MAFRQHPAVRAYSTRPDLVTQVKGAFQQATKHMASQAVQVLKQHGYVDYKLLKAFGKLQSAHRESNGTLQPAFAFGVISDIQHADIDDGFSFHGVPRFYRNARVALRKAVAHWQQQGGLDFAVHFGDILDGYQPKDKSAEVLEGLLQDFDVLGKPVYHMLGNHCLYNLPRQHLNQRLGTHSGDAAGPSYYLVQPKSGWRILVLDSYDVSLLGWPEDHPLHQQAVALLDVNNPNENKNSPDGLEGAARRWVKFGGGVSKQQLQWLQDQLQAAAAAGERVLVFSHLPFLPNTCPNACLIWNYEEVLAVLQSSGLVVATVAGHTHQNGYGMDQAGIHHIVLPAVLETPPGRDCFGHMAVFEDSLRLYGVDTMMTLDLPVLPIGQQCKLPALMAHGTLG